MRLKPLFSLFFMFALTLACAKPCHVIWTEGATNPETGKTVHTLEIQNPPKGTEWTLWFCQFRTPVTILEGEARIEHLGGTLYRVAPDADTKGESLVLRYEARPLVNRFRAPEGFYLQKKGQKPVPVDADYTFLPAEPVKLFAVKVEAADEDGAHYAAVTIDNLKRNAGGATVPNAVIEDWPDLGYRGIMLDVSRDFTSKDNLLKLIDLLDHYKVNRLHLHLGDDEGWRVEIAGLPELTSYGAYRGIPVLNEDGTISEPDALMPTYCVTPDRNDKATLGNGYYTKADFIEILRYAADRRIAVIPEFDMPGHSRAAIKSMEYRARTTGDASMLLSEPGDVSVYNSAQDYNDNAVNVALPTTYKFIDKVSGCPCGRRRSPGRRLGGLSRLPGLDEGERKDGHRLAEGLLHQPCAGHRRGQGREDRRLAGSGSAPGARHLRAAQEESGFHELLGCFPRP